MSKYVKIDKKEQNENIDFEKFVDSDSLEELLDIIKGVHNLLGSLELSNQAGTREYDKNAFSTLQIALQHGIEEIEKLKPDIEYMGNFMRYEMLKDEEIGK